MTAHVSLLFNREPLITAGFITDPDNTEIKGTPALWNASLQDALAYGGDLTRAAIGAMDLRHDRRHIVVDTKVHMLMPGMWPAIPGWHTDGVPRNEQGDPTAKGAPRLGDQETYDRASEQAAGWRPPRYHLLVTGRHCSTEFIGKPVVLNLPFEADPALYAKMTEQVEFIRREQGLVTYRAPASQVVEFGWWDIHRAIQATQHGWRFLIRVTETDWIAPEKDLRSVLRTQQQVYLEGEKFGW